MEKTVAYIRTSDQDLSPEAQLQAIQESLGPDVTLLESFTEQSGGTGHPRPGLQAVLDYLDRHQVDVLVVHRLDRLSRKSSELSALVEQFKSRGVSVHTVTDSLSNS